MDEPRYTFSQEEIKQIAKYRDKQPDVKLKVRFIALLMVAQGIEIHTVAQVTGYSEQTIENWLSQYWSKGLDSMDSFQYKPKQPYLTPEQIEQLVHWVRTENPGKIKIVQTYIRENFSVKYSNEAVRQLLKKKASDYYDLKFDRAKLPHKKNKKKSSDNISR